MKLKKTFITHSTDNEQLMISSDGKFSGMVRSNRTAAEIIDILKSDVTREEIIDKMLEKYEVDRAVLEADVDKVLTSLRNIGAIDD